MHESCMQFGIKALPRIEIENKSVLEVGAYDVNGSWSYWLRRYNPECYIGIDLENGPNVDVVMPTSELSARFGENSFDVVISTEMLEHAEDWRDALNQMKSVCKIGGTLCLTARGIGMPYHAYPDDFWRFRIKDIYNCFAYDFGIQYLQADKGAPGFFFKGKKISDTRTDLSKIKVYSIKDGMFR